MAELQIERYQESLMRDGTWASPDDARTVIHKMLQALSGAMSRLDIAGFFVAMRLNADDLQALADTYEDTSRYQQARINEILGSPVFDITAEDSDLRWTVAPEKAIAIFKNTVVIEASEAGYEMYLQEPFEAHTVLAETWQIVYEQTK